MTYRSDISGLRALAVISVIFFHLGVLKNGYLGVDVFFVISGFLITKIIFNDIINNKFSIREFYINRIRRIIPLVLFTSIVSLIVGIVVMLPEDFENLCQSIIATNLFSNNILLLLTSVSYWSIANDYKPLMHTWSLGIEEQFYLIYPFIFLLIKDIRTKYILPFLILLSIISLLLFSFSSNQSHTFYLIQYRFFELSIGGVSAIIANKLNLKSNAYLFSIIGLFSILFTDTAIVPKILLLLIIIFTIGILLSNNSNKFIAIIIENKLFIYIGKISFSLYMWHQLVFAFARYLFFEKITLIQSPLLLLLILILSVFSYNFIEQPFRNFNLISTKRLLIGSSFIYILLISTSLFYYYNAGVIRDVPELEIYKNYIIHNQINFKERKKSNEKKYELYNERIFNYNSLFTNKGKIKVLILGNSYARDFANILIESEFKNKLEISYIDNIYLTKSNKSKLSLCDYLFVSDMDKGMAISIAKKYNIDTSKIMNIGIKNFGQSMGIFYNKRFFNNYYTQTTKINSIYINRNNLLKDQWGDNYIDIIGSIINKKGEIPVFTDNYKFISHDCNHLTQDGAKYLAKKINLSKILYY